MLILVDAYSQIFRAFYAIRHLTNSKGEPTNAIFVFTRLLLKLQNDYPSERGALLFDCGKVQFRLELAPDYKANRAEMPEELRAQIPAIRKLASAFGWPLLQEPNYEADDLIAAFARHVTGPVRIVSSDKDLSQLVTPEVRMLIPAPKNGFEERGIPEVKEKFAVPPELIVDYLALLGDSVDNIPGVPGVGPKTAAEILNTCGPVDAWLDDLGKVENPKLRAKLEGHGDVIRKNRKLIALRDDLPARFSNPEQFLRRAEPDWAQIREICEQAELRSILKELPEPIPPSAPAEMVQGELF